MYKVLLPISLVTRFSRDKAICYTEVLVGSPVGFVRMANGYRVPAAPVHTEIVIKKSRFLTTAQLASTVAEARDVIAGVRAAMPDASHHVYAFRSRIWQFSH